MMKKDLTRKVIERSKGVKENDMEIWLQVYYREREYQVQVPGEYEEQPGEYEEWQGD